MFTTFYEAWHFLDDHPAFQDQYGGSWFQESLYTMVVKVNPETEEIDDNEELNTATRVWLESGRYEEDEEQDYKGTVHDIDLDCGAETFEQAIIKLANLVKENYGTYETEE